MNMEMNITRIKVMKLPVAWRLPLLKGQCLLLLAWQGYEDTMRQQQGQATDSSNQKTEVGKGSYGKL